MITKIQLVALLTFGVLLVSSSMLKKDPYIKLSDISPALALFENNEKYDYIRDSITYKFIDNTKYDAINKESASAYATIKQLDITVLKLNSGEEPLKSEYAVAAIGFGLTSLPALTSQISELQSTMTSLSPKDDFKGIKEMKKVPKATAGLNQSRKYLTNSATRLPGLITEVQELHDKMQEVKEQK